jgi:ankyrin repeat protein
MFDKNESKNAKLIVDDIMDFVDAAEYGDCARIRQMLDNGMHPDTQGPKGWTALRKAAVRNNYEIAFELLKRKASVDAANYTGDTALMIACAHGNHEMASLLLFYGADPNIANCVGRTSLMIAAGKGLCLVVGALLDACPRVDINKTDRNGKSALDMAIENGFENVAKMLAASDAIHTTNGVWRNRKKRLTPYGILKESAA